MKRWRMLISVIAALIVVWAVIFAVDYIRCSSLREPLFVFPVDTTLQDGGSGRYCGLGYTVDVNKYIDAEYGMCINSVEMRMFGRVIAASVS